MVRTMVVTTARATTKVARATVAGARLCILTEFGGFGRNSDTRHRQVPFRPGTGTGMCYNTNLDIPVYSGWYLSTRFLQVENARNYSK